jgi:hypothetical protein
VTSYLRPPCQILQNTDHLEERQDQIPDAEDANVNEADEEELGEAV